MPLLENTPGFGDFASATVARLSAILTHQLPDRIAPRTLVGGVAVILDILRASTTMVHAMGAGAAHLRPFAEPGEALCARDREPAGSVVLGGERGGVKIPGFDLGNSPGEYTPQSVGGRAVFFTTTNGTRALLASLSAERVLVGCFNNLSALVREIVRDGRPVHLVCAGTRGEVSLEDVLGAGAIAHALRQPYGVEASLDDATQMAIDLWLHAGPLGAALRRGRGGRDVIALGLDRDIEVAAGIDTRDVVPELDRATMRLM